MTPMAAMKPKTRVWLAEGAIWIWDPSLCEGAAEGPLLRFCDRIFSLDEVSSVDIHLRDATVAIQCGADRQQAPAVLKRMVASLKDAHAPRRPQIIQRLRQEVESRDSVRISRQLLGLPAAAGPIRPETSESGPGRRGPVRLVPPSTMTPIAPLTTTSKVTPAAAGTKTASGVAPATATGVRRIVYSGCAGLSFVAAVIGVWMPGLPTVPFLLLTTWLLSRSWPSLNRRLLKSRVFGPLLQTPRGLDPQVKVALVMIMVVTISMTVAFGNLPLPLLAAILVIGLLSLSQVLNLPTVRRDQVRLEPVPSAA